MGLTVEVVGTPTGKLAHLARVIGEDTPEERVEPVPICGAWRGRGSPRPALPGWIVGTDPIQIHLHSMICQRCIEIAWAPAE
jgi:hypothetical protein